MNVSNCRSQVNPAVGDQDGNEWRIQPWFSYNWGCVLRHPSSDVQHLISNYARHAADNNNCGYSQSNRLSFWNSLYAIGGTYDPRNINVPCDADCSSSTAGIIKAVGYRLGISDLKNVNQSLTTYGMRQALSQAGFQVLTESKYTMSADNLLAGDIILNDSAHVVIAVADNDFSVGENSSATSGINAQTTYYTETEKQYIPNNTRGKGVACIQGMLAYLGYDIGTYRDGRGVRSGIDGDAGYSASSTNQALRNAINDGKITEDEVNLVLSING